MLAIDSIIILTAPFLPFHPLSATGLVGSSLLPLLSLGRSSV